MFDPSQLAPRASSTQPGSGESPRRRGRRSLARRRHRPARGVGRRPISRAPLVREDHEGRSGPSGEAHHRSRRGRRPRDRTTRGRGGRRQGAGLAAGQARAGRPRARSGGPRGDRRRRGQRLPRPDPRRSAACGHRDLRQHELLDRAAGHGALRRRRVRRPGRQRVAGGLQQGRCRAVRPRRPSTSSSARSRRSTGLPACRSRTATSSAT